MTIRLIRVKKVIVKDKSKCNRRKDMHMLCLRRIKYEYKCFKIVNGCNGLDNYIYIFEEHIEPLK